MHALRIHHVLQHGVFGDEVAHHDEPSALSPETSEQRLLHPVGKVGDPLLVAAKFVVVKVVDYYVVGAVAPVPESARALTATERKKCESVACYKMPVLPVARVVLGAEVVDVAVVELEFRLQVAEERTGVVLRFAHQDHHVEHPLVLNHQPHRDYDVHVG